MTVHREIVYKDHRKSLFENIMRKGFGFSQHILENNSHPSDSSLKKLGAYDRKHKVPNENFGDKDPNQNSKELRIL